MEDFPTEQARKLPLLTTTETCAGKVYIITGANTGLGLEAAKHLARLSPARVIITSRNLAAGEAAKAQIEAETSCEGVVDVWELDLCSYESVRAFAKKAEDELDRIDGLIENAGAALGEWVLVEGMERTIVINIISTMLLGVLLLPKLSETARRFGTQPHLTFVASNAGLNDGKPMDAVKGDVFGKMNDEVAGMLNRYPLSKNVLIMAVRQLAPLVLVSKSGVVINLVTPGLCDTSLSRNARGETRSQIRNMITLMGRTPEMGSRNLLHAVIAGEESHGKFLSGCTIKEYWIPEFMTNDEGRGMQKQIWDDLSKRLEAIQPGCVSRIL